MLARFVFCIGFCIGLSVSAFAQDFAEMTSISPTADFQTGDKFQILSEKTKEIDGQPTTGISTTVLEILSDTNPMTVSSTTEKLVFNGMTIDQSHPAGPSLFMGVPFKFYADEVDLAPISVPDYELLIQDIAGSPIFESTPELPSILQSLFAQYSEEEIAHLLFKEVGYVASCHGHSLEPTSPIIYFKQLSNEMTVKTSIEVQPIGAETVEIKITDTFGNLSGAVANMLESFGEEDVSSSHFDDIQRQDSTSCIIDMRTGIVRTLKHAATVNSGEDTQTETTNITFRKIE